MKTARFARTTVAPVGVSKPKETTIPIKKQESGRYKGLKNIVMLEQINQNISERLVEMKIIKIDRFELYNLPYV